MAAKARLALRERSAAWELRCERCTAILSSPLLDPAGSTGGRLVPWKHGVFTGGGPVRLLIFDTRPTLALPEAYRTRLAMRLGREPSSYPIRDARPVERFGIRGTIPLSRDASL